jgi:hypothetical protein
MNSHLGISLVSLIKVSILDAVFQLGNISDHVKYLTANIKFISNHIKQTPELLVLNRDVANACELKEKSQVKRYIKNHSRSLKIC